MIKKITCNPLILFGNSLCQALPLLVQRGILIRQIYKSQQHILQTTITRYDGHKHVYIRTCSCNLKFSIFGLRQSQPDVTICYLFLQSSGRPLLFLTLEPLGLGFDVCKPVLQISSLSRPLAFSEFMLLFLGLQSIALGL